MTRIAVLIPDPLRGTLFSPESRADLEALGEVRWWQGSRAPSVDEAVELLSGCQIALGSWGTPHPGSGDLITRCPDLRLWEHVAGTVKAFFTEAVRGSDLIIASCKGAIADTVAEYVIGALICTLRMQHLNAADNRLGPCGKPKGIGVLSGAAIGVIGASEVGKRVMTLLRPFACRVLCHDPFATSAGLAALGAERVATLDELFARSHAVTLHTPLLPETRNLIGTRELASLRDGGIFINTARGECVDEAALIAEVQSGRLHAWLDVTNPEPAAADSPLRHLPNVVLTSHIAGPPCAHLGRQAVADVAAFCAGGSPQCVITADVLERIA